MARQRRGGLHPPELRGTLGTLIRTTLAQAGAVRSALERGAREGRARLDDARSKRRRDDALAELGEIVLELVRAGEIDLAELPEARDVIARLDELDSIDEPAPDVATASSRRRFDDRGERDDGTVSSRAVPAKPRGDARVWRPPQDAAEPKKAAAAPKKPAPAKRGGITFDDDDLADYMHPDDVRPDEPEGDA
jgi:hypothetical protein